MGVVVDGVVVMFGSGGWMEGMEGEREEVVEGEDAVVLVVVVVVVVVLR